MDSKNINNQSVNPKSHFINQTEITSNKARKKMFTHNDFKKWGKMGGRPKKEKKLSERITIRFYPEEFKVLKQKAEEKKFKNLTDYCRIVLNETQIPNVAENKLLISFAHNFTLISNYMKKRIFTEEEKQDLLNEITQLVQNMKSKIKW